jgi:signal transduction histidine kinase
MQMTRAGRKTGVASFEARFTFLLSSCLFLGWFSLARPAFGQSNSAIQRFGSIAEFLSAAGQLPPNRSISLSNEIVSLANSRGTIFIQDSSGGLLANSEQPASLGVGDVVQVTGALVKDGYSYFLRNCRFEKSGRQAPPEAIRSSAKELLTGNFDMRLVQLEGRLETEPGRVGDALQFNLRNGAVYFRAELAGAATKNQIENILPDSVVRLTGICSIGSTRGTHPSTFRILLRSADDLQLVRPPPIWTLSRTLILLAIVSCIAMVALAWVYSLRYQVRRKTEAIHALNETLARKVEARTSDLAQANKELEAFSYSISHDLKAPLRAIRNFSQFLAEDHAHALPEEGQRFVRLINEGAQRMDRLVEDLLVFSRLSRAPLRRQPIDLPALLRTCFEEVRASAPERRIEFCLKELPAVEGDSALLKQVFLNLFSNAVKYTRPREIALIEAGSIEVDGRKAVYIKDNGVGFNMKYAHKLFGVFQRLHSAEDFEGTGAGLAIVQQIVRRHGGRVWGESILDHGATFYVVLGSGDTV